MTPSEDYFAGWVAGLNEYLTSLGEYPAFELSAPASLIVHEPKGYRARPFLGGEALSLFEAYLGKRGEVIFKFYKEHSFDREEYWVEISSSKFAANLPRMVDWLNDYENRRDDSSLSSARESAKRLEDDAYQKALMEAHAHDERFGSW